jgi:hypothetical protein
MEPISFIHKTRTLMSYACSMIWTGRTSIEPDKLVLPVSENYSAVDYGEVLGRVPFSQNRRK